ncbi:MAG: cation:proton antiporter [Synechococcaceae cyanobacterium]|nr:cation:proton antiporter [Synechococcaceae cyanobacterium]
MASGIQSIQHVSLPVLMLTAGMIFLITLGINRFAPKFGVPAILGVLLFGLLLPEELTPFSRQQISDLQTFNLSMLLFYAGLSTEIRAIRGFLRYGLLLSVGGVVITTLVLGVCIWFLASPTGNAVQLGTGQLPLAIGMLVASCLGSTDAGATLSVLNQVRRHVPKRLRDLLEFESSLNDPAAILMLGMVLGITSIGASPDTSQVILGQVKVFMQSIATGGVIGILVGYLARFSVNRIVTDRNQLLVLGLSNALIGYGLAEVMGGSGFIATYVAGMVLSNHDYSNRLIGPEALRNALEPFNTMTEITVFFLFGLAMSPEKILFSLPLGLATALVMIVLARPVGVLLLQPFSPFNWREALLISWCGLRGAVPLALTHELVEKLDTVRGVSLDQAEALGRSIEGVVFTCVVLNLLVQGLSLPALCRRLRLTQQEQPEG